jgi:hypothetical protein
MDKAIELGSCLYTVIGASVDELRGKARPEYVGDMIARVQREVAEEASR